MIVLAFPVRGECMIQLIKGNGNAASVSWLHLGDKINVNVSQELTSEINYMNTLPFFKDQTYNVYLTDNNMYTPPAGDIPGNTMPFKTLPNYYASFPIGNDVYITPKGSYYGSAARLAHELGHVISKRYLTSNDLDSYAKTRGQQSIQRTWGTDAQNEEMFAEDFRNIYGDATAKTDNIGFNYTSPSDTNIQWIKQKLNGKAINADGVK